MEKKGKNNRRITKLPMIETGMSVLLVLIAIAFASLVVTPVMAQQVEVKATTTAASEIYEPGPLDVFGNANEDDTIDMRDTTYIKLVIFGKKPETKLADANNDGKVSMLDVGQTKLIILGKEKTLWYIDFSGETVMVHKPVERIIAVYYSTAEMIRTLGAKDRVVGVDDIMSGYPRFFPDLGKMPCVGQRNDLDVEAILELRPDVVILHGRGTWMSPGLEDKLKGTGIDVVRVRYDLDIIRDEIKKLGYILDEEENAREYARWIDKYVDDIKERFSEIPEDKKPTVFIEAGKLGKYEIGGRTYAGGSGPDLSVEMAGGKNIAHDLSSEGSIVDVEKEWVIVQNPDVIIGRQYRTGYETDDVSVMKAHYEAILAVPGFDHIKAVEEGRVHMIDSIILWGPGYLSGVIYLAKWLHPDLFEDLDPQAIHQEYIDRFQGIDFDVSEHGVFVYPPLK